MSTLFSFVGLSVEIIGALLLANSYLSATSLWQTPYVLLRALFSSDAANFGANLSLTLNQENLGNAVRGIALLVVGFILQAIGLVLSLDQ